MLAFARTEKPKDGAEPHTTTWFDMFRIEDGRIAEHWDPTVKPWAYSCASPSATAALTG